MLNVNIKSLKKTGEIYELIGEWEGEEGKCTADKVIINPQYLDRLNL